MPFAVPGKKCHTNLAERSDRYCVRWLPKRCIDLNFLHIIQHLLQLFALFQNAKVTNPMPPVQAGVTTLDPKFFVIGVVSMLLVLALLNLAWRNRSHGVREELVRRATQ